MAQITEIHKNIIHEWLDEYTKIDSQKLSNVKHHLVINEKKTEFVLLAVGWLKNRYIHHVVFHLQTTKENIWIHQNNTDIELEIELLRLGIPLENFKVGYLEKRDHLSKKPIMA